MRSASTRGGSRASFDLFQNNRVTPVDGDPHDDNLFQHYRRPVIELGGDVTRPLAGGAIKLVGLATRRKRDDVDTIVRRNGLIEDNATVNGGFEQLTKARRNETIGRLSWTRAELLGLSFEAGAEAAYNTLDYHLAFSVTDENGEHVPIPLPIENATVKEKRGEVYVSVGKNLSPALRIDGGVNYEFSNLKVRGRRARRPDAEVPETEPDHRLEAGRRLAHPGVDSPDRRATRFLRFHERGQPLDQPGQRRKRKSCSPNAAGNSERRAEHPLFGEGLFKLDLGHDLVSMLQDRILICDPAHPNDADFCFDAPGNLGTGKRYFASLTVDAPLDRLWSGLRVKLPAPIKRRGSRTRSTTTCAGGAISGRTGNGISVSAATADHSPTASSSPTTSAGPPIAPTGSTPTSTAARSGRRSSNIGLCRAPRSRLIVDNALTPPAI